MYSIDLINGIVVIRFNNKPGAQDVIHATDDAAKLDKNGLRLWDYSKGADLSSAEIEIIAIHLRSISFPPSKIAVLAPDNLTFGLARHYEVYREQANQEYKVFHTEQEAMNWLLQK